MELLSCQYILLDIIYNKYEYIGLFFKVISQIVENLIEYEFRKSKIVNLIFDIKCHT